MVSLAFRLACPPPPHSRHQSTAWQIHKASPPVLFAIDQPISAKMVNVSCYLPAGRVFKLHENVVVAPHFPRKAAASLAHKRANQTFPNYAKHSDRMATQGGSSSALRATTEVQQSIFTNTSTNPSTNGAVHNNPSTYNWHTAWYPIAFTKDVDKSKPYRFVLLEIPLVVWWDCNLGTWRVFKDMCPHRLVPLSEGRINEQGHLECGYHGWAFSGGGRCEVIPQGGHAQTPRACATAFPCVERQGVLFVKPSALPLALGPGSSSSSSTSCSSSAEVDEGNIPIVPELEDPGWVPQDTWRDLPLDWATLMENVIDSSHVAFTHHKSMSSRYNIADYNMQLTQPVGPTGFDGNWPTGPRGGNIGPQATEWRAPGYLKHKLRSQDGNFESLTVVYSVPVAPGKCRLINRNVIRFTKTPIPSVIFRLMPGWMGHVGSQTLLEDDQIFLHTGELDFAKQRAAGTTPAKALYMPSRADTYIVAFHKWLERFGGGGPFGPVNADFVARMGPRLTKEQLLDRYSQHTASCAQCQAALKQLSTADTVLHTIQGTALWLAVLCAAVAIASSSATAAAPGMTALAAAPMASPGEVLQGLGSWLLAAGHFVTSGGSATADPTGEILRAASFGAVAAVAASLRFWIHTVQERMHKGVYPPPRNQE